MNNFKARIPEKQIESGQKLIFAAKKNFCQTKNRPLGQKFWIHVGFSIFPWIQVGFIFELNLFDIISCWNTVNFDLNRLEIVFRNSPGEMKQKYRSYCEIFNFLDYLGAFEAWKHDFGVTCMKCDVKVLWHMSNINTSMSEMFMIETSLVLSQKHENSVNIINQKIKHDVYWGFLPVSRMDCLETYHSYSNYYFSLDGIIISSFG